MEVIFNLAGWSLYLLHPGQAIGRLLHWKDLLRVLLDPAEPFPEFEGKCWAILLEIWAEIVDAFLAEGFLKSG